MNQAKNCTYDDCYKFQGPLIEMISLKTPMKLNIDKAVRILFFFMLFCLIFKIKNVVADELKPHNVAVESSYQEKNLRPAPPIHEFDLRYPGSSHEPYYPELTAGVYPLPPDFPQNIFFSRWTRFSATWSCSRRSAPARPSMSSVRWSPTSPPVTTTSPPPSAAPSPACMAWR